METARQLREAISDKHRAANALLAEKGSQQWSRGDQDTFDRLLDDADTLQEKLDRTAAPLAPTVAARRSAAAREGFEIFLRKAAHEMTAAEAQKVYATMSTTTGNSSTARTRVPASASEFSILELRGRPGTGRELADIHTRPFDDQAGPGGDRHPAAARLTGAMMPSSFACDAISRSGSCADSSALSPAPVSTATARTPAARLA
jgi:hypothetical protein